MEISIPGNMVNNLDGALVHCAYGTFRPKQNDISQKTFSNLFFVADTYNDDFTDVYIALQPLIFDYINLFYPGSVHHLIALSFQYILRMLRMHVISGDVWLDFGCVQS